MGNKEQGSAITGGDVEEERDGGRSTFFQKKESHKITCRSGRHKTDLDILVVRQHQLRSVKRWRESRSPHSTNRSSLRSE